MSELAEEKGSFDWVGIGYEEKAFYDILVAVEQKYDFFYPMEKNISLSKRLYEKVTDVAKYSNWSKRSDTKAKLKSDIMLLLWEDGFPPLPDDSNPEDYEKVYADILEQTENFKKYYNE
jgi:type I restriction enzyme R subunit